MIKIVVILSMLAVAIAGQSFRSIAAPAYGGYAQAPFAAYGYGAPAIRAYAQAPIAYAQPAYTAPAVVKTIQPEPYDAHPQYNYGYSVHDAYTGDQKSHSETRDGDVVQGSYSLVEPDGSLRVVRYFADAINGFNAEVSRQAPQVAVKQVVQAAPVAVGYKSFGHAPALRYY